MIAIPTPLNAVVLAGGINRIELYEGYQPGYKALLSFAGRPAVQYVVEALEAVPAIGRICLVGPEEKLRQALSHPADYEYVSGGKTLMESLVKALQHCNNAPQVLFVTADLPLLCPPAIKDFLQGCATVETSFQDNLLWAGVPEDCYQGIYRKVNKGFNRFRDISLCHGNLMMTNPGLLENSRALRRIDAVYNARKNSVRAALAIGWKVGLAYLFGVQLLRVLTLKQLTGLVSRRFDVGLHPILLDHPEVAIDVDEPEDYRFVKRRLQG